MKRWKIWMLALLAIGVMAAPVGYDAARAASPKAKASLACGNYRGLFYGLATTNMSCAAARAALNGSRRCVGSRCSHLNISGFICKNGSRVWCVRGARRFSYTPRD